MLEPTFPDPTSLTPTEVQIELRKEERAIFQPGPVIPLLVRPGIQRLRARVANACAGGMGLVLDRPLEVGSVVALGIRGRKPGQTSLHSARVMHCTAQEKGTWLVGCQMARPLAAEELAYLQGREPAPDN